ncbi:MAG: UDP-N-acetylmuramoyl-L-alanine--D-glutamate ligase [Bacteroidetes bacterium]|nr:MAG: UDP-N-acetylmuramoyl-L-alanine--D-glutamate ligase [Bacteroidota bacterium]
MKNLQEEIKNKSVLLLGLGREGLSSYQWLRKAFPEKELGIADGNPAVKQKLQEDVNLQFHLGEKYLDSIKAYDIIFKSPGISLKDYACSNREKITSQTDLFLRYYGRQTIGVTGTKGKSTTSSLIAHILKTNGKKVVLLGNIGIPAFNRLDQITEDTVVVFEMSAHQLEYVHHSPKIAVLLNIFPEHLDHFKTFDAYKAAKLNIAKFLGKDDLLVISENLYGEFSGLQPEVSYYEKGRDIDPDTLLLKGSHNLNNVKAAILAVKPFGVDYMSALKSASSFKPLPHRLEYVGKYGGIHFYNDSISTIPESTVAALNAVDGVDTLILGGFDRGLDFSKLVDYLAIHTVSNLIFTGPAGKKMIVLFKSNPEIKSALFEVASLGDAFKIIAKVTSKEGVCLLSPAAASYDEFHNFEHRGDAFKRLARQMP